MSLLTIIIMPCREGSVIAHFKIWVPGDPAVAIDEIWQAVYDNKVFQELTLGEEGVIFGGGELL